MCIFKKFSINPLVFQVSFSTNYFDPQHFEAIVTVNLTALLVMATIFISVSNG